jgi:hypothetical protein
MFKDPCTAFAVRTCYWRDSSILYGHLVAVYPIPSSVSANYIQSKQILCLPFNYSFVYPLSLAISSKESNPNHEQTKFSTPYVTGQILYNANLGYRNTKTTIMEHLGYKVASISSCRRFKGPSCFHLLSPLITTITPSSANRCEIIV